jgi:AAA+ ATPase superfamily predicted ATPase
MAFIDRARELSFLEERWREPKAQFVVLWGKRRVGKTELVKQAKEGALLPLQQKRFHSSHGQEGKVRGGHPL